MQQSSTPFQFSSYSTQLLYSHFQSNPKTGLTSSSIPHLRQIHGQNELPSPPSESIFSKIKDQFSDVLVIILLIAAIVSFLTNIFAEKPEDIPPWIEPSVIFLILIVNAIIGIYQDFNAESAIKSLHELNVAQANVLRDSIWQLVPSKELVPGDIVKLTTGSKVPADLRILEIFSVALLVNQAILTGESQPVRKNLTAANENGSLFEITNMAFSGTLVVQGSALCIVVATGQKTQIGSIQSEVLSAQEDEVETPLRKKLNEFGDKLARVIGVLCVIIWLINFRNFFDSHYSSWFEGALHYFKIAVSLAVAAIPEGLPAVITTCLALGTRRMSKRKALVRNLTSVETLGCTNVICTDKTGTLTTNEMTVKNFSLFAEREEEVFVFKDHFVEGCDYSLVGNIHNLERCSLEQMRLFCQCMTMCNESQLVFKEVNNRRRISIVGLPLEGALRILVEKLGNFLVKDQNNYLKTNQLDVFAGVFRKELETVQTFEFTSERKLMTVLCQEALTKNKIAFVKGGPELLLERCVGFLDSREQLHSLDKEKREAILLRIKEYSKKGLRCLGLGFRKNVEQTDQAEEIEKDLIFIGLVAMEDPPRPEVKLAIEKCRSAGIRLIMVTGDLKETAHSIAEQLGLVTTKVSIDEYCFSGKQLEMMTSIEQENLVEDFLKHVNLSLIFYRSEPRHKRLLVSLLSKQDQIVAMTGDGVNDAPALCQADIGIAMGLSGTEVAKESADMVLADDNFGTIVKAIEEGRAIYDNMKAFIRYMISSNIGEVVSIFLGSVLGFPDIFSSVQLLWVNLVTDGLPAMALSFNKPDSDVMIRSPRHRYMVIGTYVGLATVGVFGYWYLYYDWAEDGHSLITYHQLSNWVECPSWDTFLINISSKKCDYFTTGKAKASTLSLTVLVTIEMFNSLNALSENNSILDVGIFDNIWLILSIGLSMIMHSMILYVPVFQMVFQTQALSINDWMVVVGFSFPVILIDEVLKYTARILDRNGENNINFSKKE